MTSAQRGIIGMVIAMMTFWQRVAEDGHDGQGQDDQRKGQEDVHEALQVEVEPAAEVGAADAEDGAEGRPHERGPETHEERGAGAVDQAGHHVAAERVGAEPVLAPRAGASMAPKSTATGS